MSNILRRLCLRLTSGNDDDDVYTETTEQTYHVSRADDITEDYCTFHITTLYTQVHAYSVHVVVTVYNMTKFASVISLMFIPSCPLKLVSR